MSHRLLCLMGTLFVATFAWSAHAQDEGTDPVGETTNEPLPAKQAEESKEPEQDTPWLSLSRFSGSIQADFSNAYYFRGILQERDGVQAQPWGELFYNLFSSEEGFIRDASIGAGVWASFQTENTLAQNDPRSLYEVDWYPVISLEFPEGVSLTTIYYWYTSPNDAFRHVQELNFKLAWDDSETLGKFALQPWINLAIETERTSFGPKKGEGFQMGVEPTLYEIPIDNYPITLTFPVEMGLALNDYYERASGSESTFGYLSFGMGASMPLAFIPETFGAWSIGLVGKGYWLNHTLANANKGDTMSPQVIGSIGFEF